MSPLLSHCVGALDESRSESARHVRRALTEGRNGATPLARIPAFLDRDAANPRESWAGRRRRLSRFGRTGLGHCHSFFALWAGVLTQVNDGAGILVEAAHLKGCPNMAGAL